MSLEELIVFLAVTFFSVTIVIGASTFYNRMNLAKEESYELLSTILAPINKQLQNIETGLSTAVYDIDRVTARVERVENTARLIEHRPRDAPTLDVKRVTNELTEQLSQLRDAQKKVQEQIAVIEKRRLLKKSPERGTTPFQSSSLTKTEKKILEVLRSDGPKTAPEIEKVIRKTREHTSRLMKKLWLEGYIEREVHVIPYVYRPTNKGVQRVKDAY